MYHKLLNSLCVLVQARCVHFHIHKVISPRDSQNNTTQHDDAQPRHHFYELPQARLEPTTFCILDGCSTEYNTLLHHALHILKTVKCGPGRADGVSTKRSSATPMQKKLLVCSVACFCAAKKSAYHNHNSVFAKEHILMYLVSGQLHCSYGI